MPPHQAIQEPLPELTQRIGSFVLRMLGWRTVGETPEPKKFVAIIAPHTSNRDFLYFLCLCWSLGLRPNFIGKHTLFTWPLGIFMRWCGGIPVDRTQTKDFVQQIAEIFKANERLVLGISPEGTRKEAAHWRSGFYYMALTGGVPILLAAVDYPNKEVHVGPTLEPSGDIESDMKIIAEYYKPFQGKHPKRQSPVRLSK